MRDEEIRKQREELKKKIDDHERYMTIQEARYIESGGIWGTTPQGIGARQKLKSLKREIAQLSGYSDRVGWKGLGNFLLVQGAFAVAVLVPSVIGGAITGVIGFIQKAFAWNLVWAAIANSAVSAVLIGVFFGMVTLLLFGPIFYPRESFDVVAHRALDTIQGFLVMVGLVNGIAIGWITLYRQSGSLIWKWLRVQ
jgi:hypothetical protein